MKWISVLSPWRQSLKHISEESSLENCANVWNITPHDRCQWLEDTNACELDAYIPYTKLLFCWFSSDNPAMLTCGLILFVLWLLYLFLVLGTTADNFFCPSLSVIADVLRLSENIAGVTILAFGNGAPDVFTSLVSGEGIEELIMFTELVGAGVFVTSVIAGTIAIVSPFTISAKTFSRDVFFYIFSVSWIAYISANGVIHIWESLSLIVIYLMFIGVVVAMQMWENSEAHRKAQIPQIGDPDFLQQFIASHSYRRRVLKPVKPGAFSVKTKLDLAIAAELGATRKELEMMDRLSEESAELSDPNQPKNIVYEFLYDMNPININDWKTSNVILKLILIIRAPVMLILQFFVPVVNQTAVKNGWSKLLNCLQLCITPSIAVIILDLHSIKIVEMLSVGVIIIILGFLSAIFVYVKTTADHPPKYHNVYALLGFFGATLVVWIVAGEVMAVLESIGFASGISNTMLGITLLAWGNSVGDLISNVAIARRGFARMGYAACFGGPMFNTLMGLGLSWTLSASQHSDYQLPILNSDMIPGCLAFLLCSLTTSILYLNVTGFIARPSYGYLLFSIYFVFILMSFLSEIGFIHPLGAHYTGEL